MANPNSFGADQAVVASSATMTIITEATTLAPYQRLIQADSADGSAAFAITLPFPEDMAGQTISIFLRLDGGDVTVVDQAASPNTLATLDTATDYIVIFCDGVNYIELASQKA